MFVGFETAVNEKSERYTKLTYVTFRKKNKNKKTKTKKKKTKTKTKNKTTKKKTKKTTQSSVYIDYNAHCKDAQLSRIY